MPRTEADALSRAAVTAGPWCAEVVQPLAGVPVAGPDGVVIAYVLGDGDQQRADARLIAAAPDLLALARQYAMECSGCDGNGRQLVTVNAGTPEYAEYADCPDCADIRRVIAKAEGRS